METVRRERVPGKALFRQVVLLCAWMLALHTGLLCVTALFDHWLNAMYALSAWRIVNLSALIALGVALVMVFLRAGWLATRRSGTAKTGFQVGLLGGIIYGLLSFLPSITLLPATQYFPPPCVGICTADLFYVFNPLQPSLVALPLCSVLLGWLLGWFGGLLQASIERKRLF